MSNIKYKPIFLKGSFIEPKECCDPGTYKCQVPMPLNGKLQSIDICIADIVAALNAANIKTVASCCGHGKTSGIIDLEDGRIIKIYYDIY